VTDLQATGTGDARPAVIDSDGHVNESLDAVAELMDPAYRSRRPILIKDTLGLTRILLEGRLYPDPRLRQAHTKGIEGIKLAGSRAGATDPAARLGDLDLEGIDVQVVYGSIGLAISSVRDRDVAAALARACNDYYAGFCRGGHGRLRGMAVLPLRDVSAAVDELDRSVTDLGLLGATVPPNLDGRNLDDPSFDPLWARAEALDAPIAVHWGNGAHLHAAGTERFDTHFMVHAVGHPFEQMLAMASLICGGVLDRFPRLRVGFLEAGCGWAPYWVERLHEHWERRGAEMPALLRDPVDFFHAGRCFVGAEPQEAMVPGAIGVLGDGALLFASDYPHSDSLFPECTQAVRARDDLDDRAKEKLLGANAAAFYGLSASASA
jgi:predicted TIM-barrel fold metal-dependent hydrolase